MYLGRDLTSSAIEERYNPKIPIDNKFIAPMNRIKVTIVGFPTGNGKPSIFSAI